ncbi:iron(III) dicitrate transport system permease protein FecC [Klebsiella grimontii]|uniref:Iron(III) dicitrate transport system permease protein FecC n=1 Tax=Klebsiella grimontii TaxID=2058152 RepID=A0A7H4P5R4_9ENTR|nr:iron(III) dicitrate transport system permease protein FecC [Klebsiella grimontii]
MKLFHRARFIWGLPLLALTGLFWLSLFCYSPIPISPLNALHALLAPDTPALAEALVLNLRLPRSLVAIMLGASLAMSGALLQTLTHNPLASPSLLGINSGAALAMALTSAFSPAPLAGFSLALIAACGGGLSWLLVMTAGGSWRQQLDRHRADPRRYCSFGAMHGSEQNDPAAGGRSRLGHSDLACGRRFSRALGPSSGSFSLFSRSLLPAYSCWPTRLICSTSAIPRPIRWE